MEQKTRQLGGVFWLIDEEILAIPYHESAKIGLSKSGHNYNHKLLWEHVKPKDCSKAYNYYPRGRVEIDTRNRAIIFMSPHIEDKYIVRIKEFFGISEIHKIKYDGSRHYRCIYDEGFEDDNY